MKLFSKEELIQKIKEISRKGWHPSVKDTIDTKNDGAVGNTLEELLGIPENNLPIPNARDWELKGQRAKSNSLITIKHIEPSPVGAEIVTNLLLPKYGWKHKKAGAKYPITEMSFRSTTNAVAYTKRGFKIIVDRESNQLQLSFNADFADRSDKDVACWLASVEQRIGLGPLNPTPYWAFEDLKCEIGRKMKNCFYVIANSKIVQSREYFHYIKLFILSGFLFDNFIEAVENGIILIDFDARTGHNHGTKFRVKKGNWHRFYSEVREVPL